MNNAADAGEVSAAEGTEVVVHEGEALVVTMASEDAAGATTNLTTTLPPAFLAPMEPPMPGVSPIAKRNTQLLPTFVNEKGELATRLTPEQLQPCLEGRAMVRFGRFLPRVNLN